MNKHYALFASLLFSSSLYADYFEGTLPHDVRLMDPSGSIQLVDAPYKDGMQSLQLRWTDSNGILFTQPRNLNNYRDGIACWIYTDQPMDEPLRGEFIDSKGVVQFFFEFNMQFTGWRSCRIGSRNMQGIKKVRTGLKFRFKAPTVANEKNIFIDRLTFPKDVDAKNAPDAQLPHAAFNGDAGHWAALWKWDSTFDHQIEVPTSLTAAQQAELIRYKDNLDQIVGTKANQSLISKARTIFTQAAIQEIDGHLVGKPLVMDSEKKNTDLSLNDAACMLYGLAQQAIFQNNQQAETDFMLAWRYIMNQGIAWGSSMGSNHHYGYQIREMFQGLHLMRGVILQSDLAAETQAAMAYWSGLAETREILHQERNGLVDGWNTLTLARMISANMIANETERYRALKELSLWFNSTLHATLGNMGGIKPDGTIFHHGGHYPSYGIGGLSSIGQWIRAIKNCPSLQLDPQASKSMANALIAMATYSNKLDWSIGICGRHPHAGNISNGVASTIQALSQLNLEEKEELTTIYEWLTQPNQANPIEGFYTYNHAALGVYRHNTQMVSLKGYNTDVWGSEIYSKDNRFGRYQSYGALEIIEASRQQSGYQEAGWDWNVLPGTTTIHLPLNLLNSPVSGTLMARSTESFAGALDLNNTSGMFAMLLKEENDINNTNFTPDFVARKSVFCFDKRVIALGDGITNSNNNYPTATNLFQQRLSDHQQQFSMNQEEQTAYGYQLHETLEETVLLSDLNNNYFRINPLHGKLYIKGSTQQSKHNKTLKATEGDFIKAYIDHGKQPRDGKYEYMIMLKPTQEELALWSQDPQYRIIQQDQNAHIVMDLTSNQYGYAFFKQSTVAEGPIAASTAETMVMIQESQNGSLQLSLVDPCIHLKEKFKGSGSAPVLGERITKEITLRGEWHARDNQESVILENVDGQTRLSVSFYLGMPIHLNLYPNSGESSLEQLSDQMKHYFDEDHLAIHLKGDAGEYNVRVYDQAGRCTFQLKESKQHIRIPITKVNHKIVTITDTAGKLIKTIKMPIQTKTNNIR